MRALFRLGAVALPCVEQVTERRDRGAACADTSARRWCSTAADMPLADGPAPVAELPDDAPGVPDLHLRHRGPAEGGRAPAPLPRGEPSPARAVDGRASRRPRLVHGGAGLVEVGAQRLVPGGAATAARRCSHAGRFARRRAARAARAAAAAGALHVAHRVPAVREGARRSAATTWAAIREAVAAGEALDGATLQRWREAYGITVRDGYGQTECGAVTGVLVGEEPVPGSMGHAMPGVELAIVDGELCLRPETLPTFFSGYLDDPAATAAKLRDGLWHTGDLVRARRRRPALVPGPRRRRHLVRRLPDRPGRGGVGARVAPGGAGGGRDRAARRDRGEIVHADVVLQPGRGARRTSCAATLQDHVRQVTAPYKYPRSLRFVGRSCRARHRQAPAERDPGGARPGGDGRSRRSCAKRVKGRARSIPFPCTPRRKRRLSGCAASRGGRADKELGRVMGRGNEPRSVRTKVALTLAGAAATATAAIVGARERRRRRPASVTVRGQDPDRARPLDARSADPTSARRTAPTTVARTDPSLLGLRGLGPRPGRWCGSGTRRWRRTAAT